MIDELKTDKKQETRMRASFLAVVQPKRPRQQPSTIQTYRFKLLFDAMNMVIMDNDDMENTYHCSLPDLTHSIDCQTVLNAET
jgi:hypothetical protein